ncbi:MAG: glycosidase [Chitinivibrionales bacterium]|nr:glycosidase [Chitinivibrionales bacterium]
MTSMDTQCARTIRIENGTEAAVDLTRPVARYTHNPILTPRGVNGVWTGPAHTVVTVHNAGVVRAGDETVMVFRSHLRSGVSILGLARSADGLTNWRIDPEPFMRPATTDDRFAESADPAAIVEAEQGGVEDPRIHQFGEYFALTYSAYHGRVPNRVRVCLATTTDFRTVVRHGPVLHADMRNVVLFTKPFGGRYAALFRINDESAGDVGGAFTRIRIAYADDWQRGPWDVSDRVLMQTGGGPSAFQAKIGPGAPPIETDRGWLNIFHGVRTTMDGNPYVLGVALHDRQNPERVRMCTIPILFPSRADCRVDEDQYVHVPNVVFTCGALRRDDGAIVIYYGGNDTVMNVGFTHEDVLVELCERFGEDPGTGISPAAAERPG